MQSEPKWTKGPLASRNGNVFDQAGNCIALCKTDVGTNDEDIANAAVFAAAPDLYAALTRFRAKVYNAAIGNGMDAEWATEACRDADAALAKARGEA